MRSQERNMISSMHEMASDGFGQPLRYIFNEARLLLQRRVYLRCNKSPFYLIEKFVLRGAASDFHDAFLIGKTALRGVAARVSVAAFLMY